MANCTSNIRYIQIHKNGEMYIQFDKPLSKLDVNFERLIIKNNDNNIISIITGNFKRFTRSGIILTDWTILNSQISI